MSTYESGDGFALVRGAASMLLPAGCETHLIEALWAALAGEPRVEDVLRALLVTSDVGSLPDFALVVAVTEAEGTRAVVRGTFEVVADEVAAERSVIADPSNMWTEAVLAPRDGVVLRPAESTSMGSGLPLGDGVVRASAVRWTPGAHAGELSAEGIKDARRVTVSSEAPASVGIYSAPVPTASTVTLDPVPAAPPAAPVVEPIIPNLAALPAPVVLSSPEPAPSVVDEFAPPVSPASTPVDAETVLPSFDATLAQEEFDPRSAEADTRGERGAGDPPSPFGAPLEPGDVGPEEHTTTYDHLISGATRALTVEDAAVRPDEEGEHAPAPLVGVAGSAAVPPAAPARSTPEASSAPLGDHDGLTVSAEQLAAMQAQMLGSTPPAASQPTPVSGGGLIAGIPGRVAPVLVMATGERHTLDRGAVVGTRPSAVRASGTLPHLIAVVSPNGEISRRHLELRVTGDHVQAVDLDSTNGTRLLRVGADPVRLQPGVTALLIDGDRLDLGDSIVLTFEGLR